MNGKLGGRDVEFVMVDDESDPAKAPENTHKLVTAENVDFLVGPVHSGVAMGMVRVVRETETITVIPNAGFKRRHRATVHTEPVPHLVQQLAGECADGQSRGRPRYKTVVTVTWKYAAGEEMIAAFVDRYSKEGGKVLKQMTLPFPNQEFQAHLTEIASLKPDAVFVFFAGAGALKFVKDYAAAGLKSIPLLGSGFITDGVLQAQGEAAEAC